MAQPVKVIGPPYDELVVDTGHLEGVQRILDDLKIKYVEFDRIEAFDLALLGIAAQTDDQVNAFDGAAAAREQITAHNAELGIPDVEVTALDVLTRLLCNRFLAAEGRDLDKSIGKNRDVDQLEALPHWGGGEGPPAPAAASQFHLRDDPPGLAPATGAGMTIGVIDSALYPSPGFAGRVRRADKVANRPPRRAWEGHAAFVVGRILLRAPNTTVIVRGVLDENGMAKAWDVAYRMAELVELGATVLNMAMASYPADGKEPFLLGRAVQCVKQTALIVAAAGNHGNAPAVAVAEGRTRLVGLVLTTNPTAKAYPAASQDVVAVGAASVEEVEGKVALKPADFTPRVDWVQLWAPGVDQVSTFLEGNVESRIAELIGGTITVTTKNLGSFGGYASWSGTSGATGDVSGEIARLAETPDLEGAQKALATIRGRLPVGEYDASDIRPAGLNDWD